jgi:hypothetical protein
MRSSIRELEPAAAWRDAGRCAFLAAVIGFFTASLLQVSGMLPGFRSAGQAGFTAMVAVYFAYLILSLGYYYQRLVQSFFGATVIVAGLFAASIAWVHLFASTVLIPLLILGLCAYLVLSFVHIRISGLPTTAYFRQLKSVDKTKFQFASQWETVMFWMIMALGAMAIMWFLYLGKYFGR